LANISNELKIGITVAVAILVAFIGFRIMKDIPLFKTSKTLYTKFSRVDGLLTGNAVSVRGKKIGSVSEITYIQEEDSILVSMSIDKEFMIPKNSTATLVNPGPIGAKYISIKKSDSAEELKDGDFIKGVYDAGIINQFATKGEQLTDQITQNLTELEQLLVNVNDALNENNKQQISNTLGNVAQTTETLNSIVQQRQQDLNEMIQSMNSIFGNLDTVSTANKKSLGEIIRNLESASVELETLSKDLNQTTRSLNEILAKVDGGTGTIGKMVNDPSLYNNLDSLSVNLNNLIKNINEDPKRYLKHMRLVDVF